MTDLLGPGLGAVLYLNKEFCVELFGGVLLLLRKRCVREYACVRNFQRTGILLPGITILLIFLTLFYFI